MAIDNNLLLATSYFPPVEYFVHLVNARKAYIDIFENYARQTWRNRCSILTANGVLDLSIPVEKINGNHTATKDVIFSEHSKWQKNHLRTIEAAYRNAPYFLFYRELASDFIMHPATDKLYELNRKILTALCREIGIETSVDFTDKFVQHNAGALDLRFCMSPKARDRMHYPVPAMEPYYQTFGDKWGFQPNLSILDLLFNMGPDSLEYLRSVRI